MVAHLVKLRFLILGNTLRKNPWQLVAVIIGGLYGLGVLGTVMVSLVFLSFEDIEIARTGIILGGSATVLGWVILPLIASGTDQTVEPARLVTFPIPQNTLLLALAVSGVLGIPGIVTGIAMLGTVAAWWQHPLAAIAAVLSAAIGVLTCVVGSRLVTALSTNLGAGRRYRELRGLIAIIPLLLLAPIIFLISNVIGDSLTGLPAVANVLGLTPIGAAFAFPASIAAGDYAAAGLALLIALATLVVLTVLWKFALARALETPPREGAAKTGNGSLGLLGRFPGNPTGAVAARALTYWIRDPRYAQSLITVPFVPVLLVFYASTTDNWGLLNAAGPIVAGLLALAIYTDVSYDSTAYALHLQTGVSGVADRLGRVISLAVFAVPLTVAITVASVWYTDAWYVLPGLLGMDIALLLTGFAVSSIISGAFVFAVPSPGESPFKSKPGGGLALTLSTLGTWGATTILVVPEMVLAIISFVTGQVLYGWLSIVAALIIGGAALWGGVRWGGAILDRRGPDLLMRLQAQK